MTSRSETQDTQQPRDSRRRELRDLLISAADAARRTRQSALDATINRPAPQALRERVARFLSSAR